MKRVYLLRHAKSSWNEPTPPDRERPLAGRGRRAAKAMARHLREQALDPDLVLCSPARRARETLERLEPVLGRGAVRIEPALYEAGAAAQLAVLHEVPDHIGSVMLIGHNPSLQELALALAAPSADRAEVEAKFPTGALVTLAFEASRWRDIEAGDGILEAFVRPRDLA